MEREGEIVAEVKRLRKRVGELEAKQGSEAQVETIGNRIKALETKLGIKDEKTEKPKPDSHEQENKTIDWDEPLFDD